MMSDKSMLNEDDDLIASRSTPAHVPGSLLATIAEPKGHRMPPPPAPEPTSVQITVMRKAGIEPPRNPKGDFVIPMDEDGNIMIGALPPEALERLKKVVNESR